MAAIGPRHELGLGRGDHRLAFSEPVPTPMERLHVDAPIGSLTLVRLGNASPRDVSLTTNIGEACVDLRGDWQEDAVIRVACGVGSCDLHEPGVEDAIVQSAGRAASGARGELPVIEVDVTGVIRENVEISRRLETPDTTP